MSVFPLRFNAVEYLHVGTSKPTGTKKKQANELEMETRAPE